MQEIRKLYWLIGFLCVCWVCAGVWVCVRNCSPHNLSEGFCLLCLCYSLQALLWPLLIFIRLPLLIAGQSEGEKIDGCRERERKREVNERVCLCGCACAVVYLCPRCPCGFSAGSSLIICIFSFELLFAALRAAPTPKGPQSNSVKRQVRHKLIIRHLRIIAPACTCADVNTHTVYCINILYENTEMEANTHRLI